MNRRMFIETGISAGVLAASARLVEHQGQSSATPVEVNESGGVVDVKIDGGPFFVYNFDSSQAGTYRPFFHPVMGPNGKPITQNGEFPGTLRGHYWHRSLFLAHQKVNGVSFWEERQADCGKIVHLEFGQIASGEEGRIVERLAWRDVNGKDLLEETRMVRIPRLPPARRLLDVGITLTAVASEVTFAKTPYSLLACRVINAMCLIPTKDRYSRRFGSLVDFSPLDEGGRITNSEGKQNDACRGERARWCDFSGPLGDGTWGGIALLDHPDNPRHPTPWHNWNDMTITASFTYHEPFALRAGQELKLAYRIVVHAGDAARADLAAEWKSFAETKRVVV
jgi:hypothetical protein